MVMFARRYGSKNGLVVAITWSTDDVEQLDVSEIEGDAIGYSHTCHNYIGVVSQDNTPAAVQGLGPNYK